MKRIESKVVLIIIALLITYQVKAQHQISGRIIENKEDNISLMYANVGLLTTDSVFVCGTTSGEDGQFSLTNISSGHYILIASYTGYISQTVELGKVSQSVHTGDILMEENIGMLSEVTIVASNVINRVDRSIIFVTDEVKAHSTNGINLLIGMNLPRLIINPVTNGISLPGDDQIQFCIEGIKVGIEDIEALQPDEILRVEYINNPGLRYGDADLVINYLLKRKTSGGSLSLETANAVTTIFGNNRINGKFNHKKSQFGFNYFLRSRKTGKIQIDETQTFHFEDGTDFSHFSNYYLTKLEEQYHYFSFNYNVADDTYYFSATMRYSSINDDKKRGILQHTTFNDSETDVRKRFDSKANTPSLDLYYLRSLKNKQTFIFNLVGTYINSDIAQKYEEFQHEKPISDITSDVEGHKYSVIAEGIYEKEFKNTDRLTTGFKYMNAYTKNKYMGTENSLTRMNLNDLYGYIEYAGKLSKFSYMGGVGLSYTQNEQKKEDEYSHFTFRPKVTLQYSFAPETYLRLKGEISSTPPSLADMSAIDQHMDTLQITRGNPALKPYYNYYAELSFSTRLERLNVYFYTSYNYNPDMIMKEIRRERNKFIHTFDNQKNWQKLNSELTLSAEVIKNYLRLSLTGGVNRYMSNGNTYSHLHTNFYYRGQAIVTYKKFSAALYAQSAYDRLYGEILNGGERMEELSVLYNTSKFSIGAGLSSPFKHKRLYESKSVYVPSVNKSYVKDYTGMVMVRFSWKFNYGQKGKEVNKRINNEDFDSGIMRTN